MIDAVIEHSLAAQVVAMDPETLAVMNDLRAFMFERVYYSPGLRAYAVQAIDLIRRLVDHYLLHPDELPSTYRDTDADRITQVADHVSGMTDRFAVAEHQRLFGTPGMQTPALTTFSSATRRFACVAARASCPRPAGPAGCGPALALLLGTRPSADTCA